MHRKIQPDCCCLSIAAAVQKTAYPAYGLPQGNKGNRQVYDSQDGQLLNINRDALFFCLAGKQKGADDKGDGQHKTIGIDGKRTYCADFRMHVNLNSKHQTPKSK